MSDVLSDRKKWIGTFLLILLSFFCFQERADAKKVTNADGTLSWYNSSGKLATNKWIHKAKKTYYADENGVLATGRVKIDGTCYFFKKTTGELVTKSWIRDGKKYYYAKEDGALYTGGKYKIGSYTYYFNKNGVRRTGLKTINGKKYYFDPDNAGRMVTKKWVTIDGKYYRFNKNGVMRTNTWIGKRYVGSNGAAYQKLKTVNGKKYYFSTKNYKKLTNTTKTVNGVTYHFDGEGVGTVVEEEPVYVFVGDSRTVGMQSAVSVDYDYYIAKTSMGYNWLVSTASGELDACLKQHSNAKVIFGFGINDLGNISKYISYYKKLIAKYPDVEFYMMSVNPVNESKAKNYGYTVTNAQIRSFNKKMKAAFPSRYLDVYTYLTNNGYSTTDGIHYTASTYRKIFNYTVSQIR